MSARELVLIAFLKGVGHDGNAWRTDRAPGHAAELDIEHYVRQARIAESAALDAVFLLDVLDFGEHLSRVPLGNLEPLVTLAALSQQVREIGLIATVSTSFYPPYQIARMMATLARISEGRFGWNIVTSTRDAEARNLGLPEIPAHTDRYANASAFVDTVADLLRSWDEQTALPREPAAHRYADRSLLKFGPIGHGPYASVTGPLNVPGREEWFPLLAQATRSAEGLQFAARHSDLIFSVTGSPAEAEEFSGRLRRARPAGAGRAPLLYTPGLWPIIGSTEAEAERRRTELLELTDPDQLRSRFARHFPGVDLAEYGLDDRLPLPEVSDRVRLQGQTGRFELITNLIRSGTRTLRELHEVYASSIGHLRVVGTPERVADVIEDWFVRGVVDGFVVLPPVAPVDLELFADEVVPILVRRGLRRDHYRGPRALRSRLGLT